MFCESPKGRFPCGKCRACKVKLVNEKTVKGYYAVHVFRTQGQFVTLTYDDEHLPYGLQHEDFRNFMKRLRKLDGTTGVKFFVAGEYGEENGREHYHIVFFNYTYDADTLMRAWKKGFVHDGTLTFNAIKYANGYVNKKGYNPDLDKRPPYGRFSIGMPDGMSENEIEEMCATGKVRMNGKLYSAPRSWRYRYNDIWRYYANNRAYYNALVLPEKKPLTNDYVKGMMDYRELTLSLSRKRKKGKLNV